MSVELVPISICVILPIAIVLITSLTKINRDNKRTQVVMKAIENNPNVDTSQLIESFNRPRRTEREILNGRLLKGCIFSLVGLALVIVGIINLIAGSEFADDPVTVPVIFGSGSLAVGVSFLIVYYVTRKQLPLTEDESK